MTKKSFVVILVTSLLVTIGIPLFGFAAKLYKIMLGWPFEFTQFSFLGSDTNYNALLIDIIFWFIVIWGIWKLFFNKSKSKK